MKLPNGFGSVHKLSGKRRNPWRARKTAGWELDENGVAKQKYINIGYFRTRKEALEALSIYNEDPYDLGANRITFEEVYAQWSEEHFRTIVPSARRTWKSAFGYCKPLYKMRMKDIRVNHLEQTIINADVGSNTKQRIKSLFNQMYRYCLKHEIVDKDYAQLCNSVKREKPEIVRIPFSAQEIQLLWDNIQYPFVDMILIGIYTGFRPQELAVLKIADVDLEHKRIIGGLKTDAGRNRIVPIHQKILHLVEKNYKKAVAMESDHLFNDENGQQGTWLTYDKYRNRFIKVMKKTNMDHKPHDTRHTFITMAKSVNVNEYILKLIVGHAIEDITEKTYTHRTLEEMKNEISKIP